MYDHVYLTGFKKFGEHTVNPTEEAVKSVSMAGVTCSIVEVTTADVDKYIERISEEVGRRKGQRVLHLHFGVGPNKVYRPESFGYNNKTFRIPDNLGYQPQNEKITQEHQLDHPLHTPVNIPTLLEDAIHHGFAWEKSTDPGRYLCNYIYFRSLFDFGQKYERNHSLFIHFPTYADCSHETNVKFVTHILTRLLSSVPLPALLPPAIVRFDRIYLTGFKIFKDLAYNPTETVVEKIKAMKIQGVTAHSVDVSIEDVDEYIENVSKELTERKGQAILHLHLGLGFGPNY